MAAKNKFHFSEDLLKPNQKLAAQKLVESDFGSREETRSREKIAEEVGVSRMTLYKWDHRDENFIAYKNYLASGFMDSHLSMVYKKLLEGIEQGSMKGIETFLKRIGDMDTNSEVTVNQGEGFDRTIDERKQELLARINNDGAVYVDGHPVGQAEETED